MRLDGRAETVIGVADRLLMIATETVPMDHMDIAIRVERGVYGTAPNTLFPLSDPAGTATVPCGSCLMVGTHRCGVYDIAHEVTQMMVDVLVGQNGNERPVFIRCLKDLLRRLAEPGVLDTMAAIIATGEGGILPETARLIQDTGNVLVVGWCRSGGENWGQASAVPGATLAYLDSLPEWAIPDPSGG